MPIDAEWDDEKWEDEDVDDDPDPDDDDEPTVPCPYCRREILEDVERCPYCDRDLSDEDAPVRAKPWWIIVGTLACLYIFYRWIVG
jgi:hypothetical protein